MMDLSVQSSQAGRAIADLGYQTQPASVPRPQGQSGQQAQGGREVVTYSLSSTPDVAQSQAQPVMGGNSEQAGNYPDRNTSFLREEDISDYMLENAFNNANRALNGGAFRLQYVLHEATNMVAVSVLDSVTGDVIREIPPESRLDLYARIAEFTGLLFDQSS
ncbi:MAG: flagellar protein FlaG [Defluviitaleaceae bacterium]|nr:flagellar protein FlaG [Defluviitaleaceae bacterium]